MASQHQPPPSLTATPRRAWWSRPISTFPIDRNPTCRDAAAYMSPCWGSLFTVIAAFTILNFLDQTHHYQTKFSIQSINVSPSTLLSAATATWHIDFLVENPSSRYFIYYDDFDDVMVRLGSLNAAVLNISRVHVSRHLATFSLAFVAAEEGRNDVVLRQVLDVKLRGQHKLYVEYDVVGYFDVRCRNLTRISHGNIDKIICQSSFIPSRMFV